LSTTPPKSSSNLAPWLTLTGSAGVGIAAYMLMKDGQPKQLKSPLDPNNFVNFKLKKVEPYNHNTSRYLQHLAKNGIETD
jgi:cytochrome-b5 reductase